MSKSKKTSKKNIPSKPIWVKASGLSFVALLVLNMILMGFGVYGEMVFWIVLVVLALASWILVKATKNK